MTHSSWEKFTNRIPPIFFNPTLRFLLLRTICVSVVLLIFSVPTQEALLAVKECVYSVSASESTPILLKTSAFVRKLHIYIYVVCSCTFLHHFASAFGPTFSLPGVIDFALTIGEAISFSLQTITGQWAPIPTFIHTPEGDCQMHIEQTIIPKVSVWLISISLVVIAIMRFAEALESNGRYFWATYDITGYKLTPGRAQYQQGTRPNGFKVITGVQLWTEHFTGEGKWLIRSRGMVALFLMIVAIAFAFSTVIVDPSGEGAQLPVKVSRSVATNPSTWNGIESMFVIVGITQSQNQPQIEFSGAITVSWYGVSCSPIQTGIYVPTARSALGLLFVTYRCYNMYSGWIYPDVPHDSLVGLLRVNLNYTTLWRAVGEGSASDRRTVQVMIGHCRDPLATIRRTELPVVLLPGMNLVGFAQQHIVRQFKSPLLAPLGIFVSFDEFIVSEITHLQPNSLEETPSSNETASLVVFPRIDFSDLKIAQDYQEKSVLKGLSSVGGLWAFLGFIFGALFGSSLVRVVFGVKPLSITGVAHNFSERTKRSYREKYSNINPKTIDEGKDLDALLVNHLLDVDFFSKDATSPVALSSQSTCYWS